MPPRPATISLLSSADHAMAVNCSGALEPCMLLPPCCSTLALKRRSPAGDWGLGPPSRGSTQVDSRLASMNASSSPRGDTSACAVRVRACAGRSAAAWVAMGGGTAGSKASPALARRMRAPRTSSSSGLHALLLLLPAAWACCMLR